MRNTSTGNNKQVEYLSTYSQELSFTYCKKLH